MVSTYIGAPVLFILLVAVVILTIFSLYYYDQVLKRNQAVNTNQPYCFREICSTSAPPSLIVSEDPQKYNNQDFNFCYTNAASCEVISALQVCSATNNPTTVTADQVATMANYYNTQYYPRCQYGFGGGQTVDASQSNPSGTGPNSTNLVNGPNDDALVALVQCSKRFPSLAGDQNIAALQVICGPTLCPAVS